MKTKVSKSVKYGFVLTEQELRRIYDIAYHQMEQAVGNNNVTTMFNLKYKNDFEAERKALDEVIAESNGGVWELQSLSMEMDYVGEHLSWQEAKILDTKDTKDKNAKLKIKFTRSDSIHPNLTNNPIKYEIEGDRDWVYLTSSQLDDRFAKMKHFTIRSFIVSIFPHMIGFIPIMVGLLLCIITPILILFTPLNPSSNYYTSPFIKVAAIPAGVLIASVVFLVLLLTGFFAIIYFFPPYNFCWGDYLTTFQKKQSTGKYILTVVIFGLVLSVAGSIIATLITK